MKLDDFSNNSKFERDFYKDLLKQRSDFKEALNMLGSWSIDNGHYEDSLKAYLDLVNLHPHDSSAWYNLSCAYSVLDQIQNSLNALKKSVLLGFSNFDHMLKDPDLINLRETQDFKLFYLKLSFLKGDTSIQKS